MRWRWKIMALSKLSVIIIVTLNILDSMCLGEVSTTEKPDEELEKEEKEAIEELEKHATKLDIDKFSSDPVLIQSHTEDGKLIYLYSVTKSQVFTSSKIEDAGRDVIIVGSDKNSFAIPTLREGKKRQFILLKKAGGHDDEFDYYVSFVFIRDLQVNETHPEVLTIDGKQSVPEYDIWDHRAESFYAGWENCEFSTMFTCVSRKLMGKNTKRKEKQTRRKKRGARNMWRYKRTGGFVDLIDDDDKKPVPPPPQLMPFVVPKGFDTSDIKDLYFDFDYHRFEHVVVDDDELEGIKRIDEVQRAIAKNFSMDEKRKEEVERQQHIPTEMVDDVQKMEDDLAKAEKERHKVVKEAQAQFEQSGGKSSSKKEDFIDDYVHPFDEEPGGATGRRRRRKRMTNEYKVFDHYVHPFYEEHGGTTGSRRRRRMTDEDEEIGKKNLNKLQEMLTEINRTSSAAYLVEPAIGMKGIPGIKSLLIVADSEKDLESLRDEDLGVSGDSGVLVMGIGASTPGILQKKGILVQDKQKGLRWLSKGEDLEPVDAILSTGNSRLRAWDVVQFAQIESTVPILVEVGLSKEESKLALLGSQIVKNAERLVTEGLDLGWRVGTDTVGVGMNGGPYRRQGLKGKLAVPPNNVGIYGNMLSGAGFSGQMFFFPMGSMTKAKLIVDNITLEGYYQPSKPGVPDGFFSEDEALTSNGTNNASAKIFSTRGKIIPTEYPETIAELGMWGFLKPGFLFTSDAPKIKGFYDETVDDWRLPIERIWIPSTKDKVPVKPSVTVDGKPIVYGNLFSGMVESPHIFIADGDSLSGFFIPYDENLPNVTEAAHGVLTPTYPGGHAIFHADHMKEVEFFKEIKGVFTPDAMGYQGGFSGIMSRTDMSPQKFSLVLDRPSVEFMYIKDYPDTKDVWSVYLKPGEFKWQLPPLSTEEEESSTEVLPKAPATSAENTEDDADEEKEKIEVRTHYGSRITTRKTEVFIPIDFEISGTLIMDPPIQFHMLKAFDADVMLTKPGAPMTVTLWSGNKSQPEDQEALKTFNGATGIWIPHKFPKGDAIVTKFLSTGHLRVVQPIKSHFFTLKQDIWTPIGFREWFAVPEGQESLAKKAEKDAKDRFAPEATRRGMPGVLTKPKAHPKKVSNYKFGSLHDPNSEALTENQLDSNRLPHLYTFGYFIKSEESPHPIFVPETGNMGMLYPEKGSANPEPVFFFPRRPKMNLTETFLFKERSKFTKGKKLLFKPTYSRPSLGYLPVTFDGEKLVIEEELDVIPGWRQVDAPRVKPESLPRGWKTQISQNYLKYSKKRLKYVLLDIAGAYKGVVVQGAESVDDPNNPIFQMFLHYKAQRDGDVNPWGHINVVDPIQRASVPPEERVKKGEQGIFGGITRLGNGTFLEEVYQPLTMAHEIMSQFSMRHWEYKKISEALSGVKRESLKMGAMDNVVNMMDFRMYLYRMYSLKRARYGDAWARIYVPYGAEHYLTLKKKARPSKKWIETIVESGSVSTRMSKSTSVNVAVHFQLNEKEMVAFERPLGKEVPDMSQITHESRPTMHEEWGDGSFCDEIVLDLYQQAQLNFAIQKSKAVSGVDLGFALASQIGFDLKFSRILRRLLGLYNRKNLDRIATLSGMNGVPLKSSPQKTNLLSTGKNKDEVNEEDKEKEPETEAEKSDAMMGRTFTVQKEQKYHAQSLPGWKVQFRPDEPNGTLAEPGMIFYGLGNCKQEEFPSLKLWKSKKPSHVLIYFLKVMRIDCMENAKERIYSLINEGYLDFDGDTKFFRIPSNQKVARSLRATPTELKKLSVAFEFHAFTRTYYNARYKGYLKERVIQEPYCNISRSAGFLTEMSLYIITRAPRLIPAHGVRMIRNLLATLRTVMTKLYQDGLHLDAFCADCYFDKMVNVGDQFRVTSLIQFIINGLGEYDKGSMLRPSFKKFVKMNVEPIQQRVWEYSRQFPLKRRGPQAEDDDD